MERSPCSAISFIFRRMYLHMNNRLFSRKDLVRLIIPLIVDQFLQVAVGLPTRSWWRVSGKLPSPEFP